MSKASDHSYSYGKTNANYWQEQYPGIFDKVSGATKHANLSQPTPRKRQPTSITVPQLRRPERAGDVLVLWLPLPHKVLHKNGRTKNLNWKAKLTAAAKEAARFTTSLALQAGEGWKNVRLDATFWLERRHDDDGLSHWLVPYRDGIAAAMGCSDSGFQMGDIRQVTGRAAGERREVEIQITNLGTA